MSTVSSQRGNRLVRKRRSDMKQLGKSCRCGETAPAAFSPSQKYTCRSCQAENGRRAYSANPVQRSEWSRKWKLDHPEYSNGAYSRLSEEQKEQARAYARQWQKDNPEAKAAHNQVLVARKHGIMVNPTICSGCGRDGKTEGHHDDYSKPLEVRYLCHSCHLFTHRGPLS